MNSPPRPFRMPHPRHWLAKVTQKTAPKALNTVIESWVDARGDIDAINRGEAVRRGDTYEINNRIYRSDHDGHSYPVTGVGFHQLDRPAFKALGVYNAFGQSPRAEEILDRMGIATRARLRALQAWHAEHRR